MVSLSIRTCKPCEAFFGASVYDVFHPARGDCHVRTHARVLFFALFVYMSQGPRLGAAPAGAQIESKNIRIEFNSLLHSRVVARFDGKEIPLGDFAASESLTAGVSTVRDFTETARKSEAIRDERGRGRRLTI